MRMDLGRLMVIFIIALLLCISQPFWLNFPLIFGNSVVVGQRNDARKFEADKLFEQGVKQRKTEQYKAALKSFQEALIIYQEMKVSREVKALQGKVLQEIGHAYFQLGDNTKAIDYLQQAIVIAQEIKHRLNEGVALVTLGLVYSKLQDDAKAIDCYNQSLVIAREIKNSQLETLAQTVLEATQSRSDPRTREAGLLYSQAVKQYNNSQFEAALQTFKQTLIIYQEIRDRYNEGNVLNFIGVTYRELGNYTKAINSLEQSLTIATEIQSSQIEEYALNNLGNVYIDLGDYVRAIEYFQRDLKIMRERLKNPKGEENIFNNIANAYIELGDYVRAIDYYQQALTITRELKNREGEGATLNNLGLVYLYLGDYNKSMWYSQQSLSIAQNIKSRGLQGAAQGNLGAVYSKLGNYPKAFDYYNHVLTIAREIKNPVMEGKTQGSIGSIHFDLGQWHESIKYYKQWLRSAKKIKDRQSEVGALNGLGTAYLFLEDYIQSIEYLQQALTLVKDIQDRRNEGMVLNNLGFAFYKFGNLAAASKTLTEAIKVRESLRSGLLEDNDKVSIFEQHRNSFGNLQKVFIDQNQTDAALEISERGRARAFVELLASRISSNPKEKLPPPPNIEDIKQIAKTQNATLVQYSITGDDFKVAGKMQFQESEIYIWVVKPTGEVTFRKADLKPLWKEQNIFLRDKVDQTRQSIVKGVNVASRGNKITLTPGDRVKLNDDDPDWEAWQVVSVDIKNSKITIRLPSWEASKPVIERPIADVVKKIGINSSGANVKNLQLQELYQLLIQPIADLLPKEETARVIFIPQDALFLVPFPALQDPSGQYLVDKHTILTAPSIQVLESTHKLRQKVPGSATDILIVGNPTMPKISKIPGEPLKQLDALPGSEKEALAIASFWKSKALIGNQATEEAVLAKLPNARIIHLATHGWFDNFQGLESGIALAPSSKSDGLLKAEDIFKLYAPPQGLPLRAEIVVLSACDTGQGRLTGDGVIGLSRSIIAAGVPSVIVSLWSIPDAPTAELMTDFYQNLQRQQDKATALRQAMLTTKKKHPNPADWGAFTLIGESE
jgi:CHAT domain-containing protein/Flp pilus assembly protein TadD